jgi:hypothetical protein
MCPSDDVPNDQDDELDQDLSPAARAAQKARAATARLVRELVLHDGPVLPPLAATRILALGQAAVEPLINLMSDSRLRAPRGPAGGWVPVHAAKLLGQLDPEAAVEPLLDVLATTAQLSPLRQAVEKALAPLGAPLVSPILARLPTAVGGYRRELWFLLANARVRDARIFVQLLGALAESPEDGAMYLAEYGDKAALPELSRAPARPRWRYAGRSHGVRAARGDPRARRRADPGPAGQVRARPVGPPHRGVGADPAAAPAGDAAGYALLVRQRATLQELLPPITSNNLQ